MSVNEIIEQIKRLPRAEQQQVARFMRTLEQQRLMNDSVTGVSDRFKRVADEVFTTNAELFKKLAE